MFTYKPKPDTSLSVHEVTEIVGFDITQVRPKFLSSRLFYLCPISSPLTGGISFFDRDSLSETNTTALKSASLGCLLVPPNFQPSPIEDFIPVLRVEHPQQEFLKLVPYFFTLHTRGEGKVHPTAIVSESASVHPKADIGAYCVIGDSVTIGAETIVYPHVTIYDEVSIGDRCILHAHTTIREGTEIQNDCVIQPGAVIGSDGFGYIPHPTTGIAHVPQVGTVTLSSGVDLGANSTIDRATIGFTTVGQNTKIDNLVQIGHNVQIGSFSLLCAQSGVGGSTTVGSQVTLGGQVGVADHIEIADNIRIGGKGGVVSSLSKRGDYLGMPAIPALLWKRQVRAFEKLCSIAPKILQFFKNLER